MDVKKIQTPPKPRQKRKPLRSEVLRIPQKKLCTADTKLQTTQDTNTEESLTQSSSSSLKNTVTSDSMPITNSCTHSEVTPMHEEVPETVSPILPLHLESGNNVDKFPVNSKEAEAQGIETSSELSPPVHSPEMRQGFVKDSNSVDSEDTEIDEPTDIGQLPYEEFTPAPEKLPQTFSSFLLESCNQLKKIIDNSKESELQNAVTTPERSPPLLTSEVQQFSDISSGYSDDTEITEPTEEGQMSPPVLYRAVPGMADTRDSMSPMPCTDLENNQYSENTQNAEERNDLSELEKFSHCVSSSISLPNYGFTGTNRDLSTTTLYTCACYDANIDLINCCEYVGCTGGNEFSQVYLPSAPVHNYDGYHPNPVERHQTDVNDHIPIDLLAASAGDGDIGGMNRVFKTSPSDIEDMETSTEIKEPPSLGQSVLSHDNAVSDEIQFPIDHVKMETQEDCFSCGMEQKCLNYMHDILFNCVETSTSPRSKGITEHSLSVPDPIISHAYSLNTSKRSAFRVINPKPFFSLPSVQLLQNQPIPKSHPDLITMPACACYQYLKDLSSTLRLRPNPSRWDKYSVPEKPLFKPVKVLKYDTSKPPLSCSQYLDLYASMQAPDVDQQYI